MTSSDCSYGLPPAFTDAAYTKGYRGCGPLTVGALPCSTTYCPYIPLPLRRGILRGCIQNLHLFHGLHPNSTGSAPPGSLAGNITTLQDSLDGTDCRFAPPSQRVTPLQHPRSPGGTGRLLQGSLAITPTGLAPVSKWQLARHTEYLFIRKWISLSYCFY